MIYMLLPTYLRMYVIYVRTYVHTKYINVYVCTVYTYYIRTTYIHTSVAIYIKYKAFV